MLYRSLPSVVPYAAGFLCFCAFLCPNKRKKDPENPLTSCQYFLFLKPGAIRNKLLQALKALFLLLWKSRVLSLMPGVKRKQRKKDERSERSERSEGEGLLGSESSPLEAMCELGLERLEAVCSLRFPFASSHFVLLLILFP